MITHIDNFIMSIGDLLVEFHEVKSLTFNVGAFAEDVDEYVWKVTIVKLGNRNSYVILSWGFEFQI